ncbi:MAG: thioesterase family protein [Candidatus Omnitrophica bacterium]|nr:thioesterase family protein [Candidatus Omnitrophota bacterium]
MQKRIYYHDTDCGGVVYYANYLKYLEEARTEYMDQRGLPVKKLAEDGVLFVVARQEIDYKSPAAYGDLIDIKTTVSDIGAAKIEFVYEIKKGAEGKIIASARTILVCVDRGLKPQAIPDKVREKIIT